MTPAFAVFTFVVSWWVTLFAVLPFRLKKWWKVLLANTAAAAVVTLGIYLLIRSGAIPLRYAIQ